jgi:prepilin-type N-terminal cleavage/methylation domain-containing protein
MKIFNSEKGFTIVETMVAIFILAVGTLGVASMLMMHFSSDRYAGHTRRAESLCMQKLEELKVQNTMTTPLTSGSSADQTYVYKWDVSNYKWLSSGTNPQLTQIDITVGWPLGGACTSATPESCKNRRVVTTYFKALKF